jgi:hypothetical protein
METAPLKSFATWARTALLREVTARIAVVLAPASPVRVEQPQAVEALEKAVREAGGGDTGKAAVADRVAYTWFNRIIALRFMDANNYTGVGVVSSQVGVENGQPEILAQAKRGTIDAAVVSSKTRETVTGLLNGTRRSDDPQGEAYALLLADYCRHWNRAMPFMFEREGDFTELLIPVNLLAEESVLNRAVKVLTADVCQDVEVIGWLYQFYISERKDEVFAGFKKNKKASADEIPAATQLFTPHWIVRYLVENSLGRLWMLNRPSSRLIDQMRYYIAPVDEETDFVKVRSPEELKVLDPACGSGHMLTYAFDLIYAIYEEEGYAPAEIPGLIVTNNLYGLEIDPRAGALAAFALTMKCRAKQRTFFNKQVEPNVCVLEPIRFTPDEIDFLSTVHGNRHDESVFWNQFEHADSLGSLIEPNDVVTSVLARHLEATRGNGDLLKGEIIERAKLVVRQAEYLMPCYAVVVANPPYMGSVNMGDRLAAFAAENYPTTRTDLYSMFMQRVWHLACAGGTWGVITPHGWMFQSSFIIWRKRLLNGARIETLTQFGRGIFGSDWASAAYVAINCPPSFSTRATYRKLFERPLDVRARGLLEQLFLDPNYQRYIVGQDSFLKIDGAPIAFSLGAQLLELLASSKPLSSLASPKQGLITGDNDRFLRFWWEVSRGRIRFGASRGSEVTDVKPWAPYLKGGPPRRWAGNELHVVRWARDGHEIRNFLGPNGRQRSRSQNTDSYFRAGLTWSTIAGEFAMRAIDAGSIFGARGSLLVLDVESNRSPLLGYLNSGLVSRIISTLSPTLDFSQGPVGRIPVPDGVVKSSDADQMIDECLSISRRDWNANEVSMEFAPALFDRPAHGPILIEAIVRSHIAGERGVVERMSVLEASLDRHYESIAGDIMADSVQRPPTLSAVELLQLDPGRQAAALVKDLISYSVGCMLGRYSLDEPGVILADQGGTLGDYLTKVSTPRFTPDRDNVIPIVDGDWFEDDIVARFRTFLRVTFGEHDYVENLRFVSKSLGVKDIRDYFLKSFYNDHVQRYKKRPIYWLFSSPKGSFNALIYMHRYTPSTVSTVLNDYLREFRAKLASSLQQQESLAVGGGTPRQQAAAQKEADRLRKVLVELEEYEHDLLYPLASRQLAIDLDDGVKANYPKFGAALKKIPGLEASGE